MREVEAAIAARRYARAIEHVRCAGGARARERGGSLRRGRGAARPGRRCRFFSALDGGAISRFARSCATHAECRCSTLGARSRRIVFAAERPHPALGAMSRSRSVCSLTDVPSIPPKQPRILVVDDEPGLREMLGHPVSPRGLRRRRAARLSSSAVEAIRQSPDAVRGRAHRSRDARRLGARRPHRGQGAQRPRRKSS